jgi:hypothetical protein
MFERGLILLPLLGLASSALVAQDTTLTTLRHRADSLAAEWRRADVLARVADSMERERAPGGRDTIAVGALRIIANRSPLPLREAATRAWVVVDSLYGPAAQSLRDRPYFILAVDPDTATRRPVLRVGFEVSWDMRVEDLTNLLLANIPLEPPDRGLKTWLGGPLRPRLESTRDFTRLYVRLVTAPSQSARLCFLGDIRSCRSVLDLDDADSSYLQWYPSPEERRAVLVRSFADYFNRPATAATWRQCMRENDADCLQLLRMLPHGAIPPPLGSDAHRLLAHVALRIGGRAAYARLLADSTVALRERLAAAAGVGFDTLLARWHAEVLAARPAAVTVPRSGVPVALGWILLLIGCGLRSSRWRVA